MKCERIRTSFPEYIGGSLNPEERRCIEKHLSECEKCAKELASMSEMWAELGRITPEEPSPSLRTAFYEKLETWRAHTVDESLAEPVRLKRSGMSNPFIRLLAVSRPVLAAACLILGVAAGMGIERSATPRRDVAELRKEVTELHGMVTASLLNQSSAIERLKGIALSRQLKEPGDEVLSLLLLKLNSDSNVNVRLAAVGALSGMSDLPWIRAELVASLSRETSPLVQIALIDLLAGLRETRAVEVMRALSLDTATNETVKKHARWGIQQLL